MSYDIYWKKNVVKDLGKLELEDKERIIDKIEWFAENPDRKRNIKFIGKYECLRYRIGDFRIFFSKNDENQEINILAVDKRPQAYR